MPILGLSVIIITALLNKKYLSTNTNANSTCLNEYTYKAKSGDVYIRKTPGKSNTNQPLYTLRKNETACFTQKVHLYTEKSGVKTPWISVKTMNSNQVDGWVNRCFLEGKSIGIVYEKNC